MSSDTPKIIGIQTCKGRLEHVKQTSTTFLESTASTPNVHHLLVDYGCPEKTGEWVKETHGPCGRSDAFIMNPNTTQFHKTIALNAGARYAIGAMNADYLLFFDADTFVYDGFIEKITPLLNPERFIFVEPMDVTKDLTGLLILHQQLFRRSGGFEESFRNWGAEDLEYRLRLYAKHNAVFDLIDGEFLGSIPHSNDLRTQFYTEKNVDLSNVKNVQRMRKMFALYRNEDLNQWRKLKDAYELTKLLMLGPLDPIPDPSISNSAKNGRGRLRSRP